MQQLITLVKAQQEAWKERQQEAQLSAGNQQALQQHQAAPQQEAQLSAGNQQASQADSRLERQREAWLSAAASGGNQPSSQQHQLERQQEAWLSTAPSASYQPGSQQHQAAPLDNRLLHSEKHQEALSISNLSTRYMYTYVCTYERTHE